jgi:hypothetical protein
MGRASSNPITIFRVTGIVFLALGLNLGHQITGLSRIHDGPPNLDNSGLLVDNTIFFVVALGDRLTLRVDRLSRNPGLSIDGTEHTVLETFRWHPCALRGSEAVHLLAQST